MELFEVLIDVAAGSDQRILCSTASIQTAEVMLIYEVVNQVVPQKHQCLEFIFYPGETCLRQAELHLHGEPVAVLRESGCILFGGIDLVGNNI
ncbi:hypothetical protein [Sulfitobacter geojensis]|uniref:hypothetical protein n=1 Tax=Sulfitobacter geojensis TaxID=1342299 RepID=UPI0024925F06|nr:hypothetical protein [Sulfitobacter geojensis]